VGNGVNVGAKVAVGGMSVAVFVGMAACVWVTAIQASAAAVLARSAELRVGSGAGPHAASKVASKIVRMYGNLLFIFSPLGTFLPQNGEAPERTSPCC